MIEVKAPDSYARGPRPWVFLAGSIEKGTAELWQKRVAQALEDRSGTLLNPRRDDWDDTWPDDAHDVRFRTQVEWELAAQEAADSILMYFSPPTRSPIT